MLRNLIDKMKLPFRKERELLSKLYDVLGFYPSHVKYYRQALTHKSQRGRDKDGRRQQHNERLEYLGDAIIGAIVSDVMYHRFPTKGEGFLTNTRSKVVQRESLNRLADQLGVTRLVRVGKGTSEQAQNIGGNALEALVGAIYLDRGYDYCRRFIHLRIVKSLGDLNDLAMREINYKSKLIEWAQKNRFIVQFPNLPDATRKDENNTFVTGVIVEGIDIAQGEGANKKESHQQAAFAAWERIQNEGKLKDKIIAAHAKRRKHEDESNTATVPGLQRANDDTALRAEQRHRNKAKHQQQNQNVAKNARQERDNQAKTDEAQPRQASKGERQPREERQPKPAPEVLVATPTPKARPQRVVAEVAPEVLPDVLPAPAEAEVLTPVVPETITPSECVVEQALEAAVEPTIEVTAVEASETPVASAEIVTATPEADAKPAVATLLASLQQTASEVAPEAVEEPTATAIDADDSAPITEAEPKPAPTTAPAIASMLSALQETAPSEVEEEDFVDEEASDDEAYADDPSEAVDRELDLEANATRQPRQSRQGQQRRGRRRTNNTRAAASGDKGDAPASRPNAGRATRARRRPRPRGGNKAEA